MMLKGIKARVVLLEETKENVCVIKKIKKKKIHSVDPECKRAAKIILVTE